MARPRPWTAHPGHPGFSPRRRRRLRRRQWPGLPPPSSQPAGPPGRPVRLRALIPPLCGRGLKSRVSIGPASGRAASESGAPRPSLPTLGPGRRPSGREPGLRVLQEGVL
uniref:uncharacterized protein LOC118147770 n=1 Tax=Callithrix jacchus TaxID=9483 RepID=UPI00159F5B42|nr:uncharacterized protein LOC118147770 [Callithrix jacchus]